jgi:hypothetical protein
MSRTLRGLLAALLAMSLLAAPIATADAKPKKAKCQVSKEAKGKKHRKHCKKPKRKPKAAPTPVTVDLLDGSAATVDIPAVALPGGFVLPGTPTQRTVPISGRLNGQLPGGYQLGKDNKIVLTGGTITPGPVDLLSDASCANAPVLRLNPASTVSLSKTTPSTGTVYADGRVTANVNAALRLAFDSRTETGCDKPLVTMGASESLLPVALTGQIAPATGLKALTLDGPAAPLTVAVCLAPGDPSANCTTPPAGYPVSIAVHVVVGISIG